MKPKLNLKLAPAFPVIARAMSAARGNLAKRLKRSRRLQISLVTLAIFTPLALLGLWLGRAKAAASWFDDSFSYRNSIAISSHTSAETNVYISVTIDTSTSGQFQSDCGDLRFTTVGGDLLPYYIVSGCGTATTIIHVFFQSFPAGAQTIYYYYGNPTADNGFSGTDFATEATGYVIGSTGSQEKGGAPVAYWKFDDGTGTNAQDSSPNNNDGTISGATWVSSDSCVSSNCLQFDGTNDVVTVANTVAGIQTVAFWVRPITTSEQFIDLNGSATLLASSGTITASGFTSPTIYVDGRVSSTIAANKWQYVTVTTGTALSGSAIKVGQISTNYGQAFLDDVKIYNYARTAGQVKTDFASRGSSKGSSVIARSAATRQSDALSNGLVGYWKMDEASANSCTGGVNDSCDSSGNANNGAWNGDATTTAGKFGNGTTFDGTGDYVDAGTGTSSNITGGITLSAWIKPSDVSTYHVILAKSGGTNASTQYELRQTSVGTGLDFVISNGTVATTSTYASILSTTNWYHVVGVFDGVTIRTYVNGIAGTSATFSGTQSTTAQALTFGKRSAGGSELYFNGSMDETRIYNRALSPKEVRDLYNWAPGPVGYWNFEEGSGQSANDTSGNSNTGTWNGTGTTHWTTGKYGKAGGFNGSDDYVQVSDNATLRTTKAMTLGAWVYNNTLSGQDAIITRWDSSSTQSYLFDFNSGAPRLLLSSDGTTSTSNTTASSTLSTGRWYYLSAVYDGTAQTVTFYVDGTSVAATTSGTIPTSLFAGTSTVRIAYVQGDTSGVNGKIDDVRIYSYARTQKQIVEDMLGGGSVIASGARQSASATVGYWKFDEGYGTAANNSGSGGSATNGTITNATWSNSGKFGKALSFDGSGDCTNVGGGTTLESANSITLSTWIYPTTLNAFNQIIAKRGAGTPIPYQLSVRSGGLIYFSFYDTAWRELGSDSGEVTINQWYHLLVTYDQGTAKIYKNGKLIKTSTSLPTTLSSSTSTPVYIGCYNGNTEVFTGLIDEVKIYNYALTSDEVKTDYNHGTALSLGSAGDNASAGSAQSSSQQYCVPGDSSACTAPVGE